MRAFCVMIMTIAVATTSGCHSQPSRASSPAPNAELTEAQTHFTYKGKPIPPFFLADFYGGPEANDFWTIGMGRRVSSVAVDGLFSQSDGAYGGCKFVVGSDGFVSFDLPCDESAGPRSNGYLCYRFVGTTSSGITVLEYVGNTGGSGTVPGIVFVRFELASVGVTEEDKHEQLMMRFLGEESWGDRVYRDIALVGDELRLGPERSNMPDESLEPARTMLLK